MIEIEVNHLANGEEYTSVYKLERVAFGEAVAACKTLHPNWTKIVATLINTNK